MTTTLIQGDARHIPLADGSVQCVVTSPPYFGLRDYGTARWAGGDGACEHKESGTNRGAREELPNPPAGWAERACGMPYRDTCGKCGARRVDAQIGLESSVADYVATMVQVFREVRRVLRDDGVVFMNLGDSYNSAASNQNGHGLDGNVRGGNRERGRSDSTIPGLGSKQLLGIPWRVAFALQADGWVLRADIVWSKPNPMPESVTDRPTKSHEYIFLLAKQKRYYYDAEAVREKHMDRAGPPERFGNIGINGGQQDESRPEPEVRAHLKLKPGARVYHPAGRNARSVWTITPKPLAYAHFATFAPELVRRCIAAGTSERGQCPHCGTAWRRVTTRETEWRDRPNSYGKRQPNGIENSIDQLKAGVMVSTLGWQPGCTCPSHDPVPQVVLDIFGGAGTVPLVASNMGRRGVMVELNPKYIRMAARRISRPHARPERAERQEHHPLFAGLE